MEAKWFYNYLIADLENRLNKQTEKLKEVEIKTPNGFEKRELKIIDSQIKQCIVSKIKDNLKALKNLKEKVKKFPFIAVQKDDVKSWHERLFGKQVQNTGIGRITARLRYLATLIPVEFVSRYEATTQTCCKCGFKQKISLSQRTFKCPKCGLRIDRDLNSAWNILKLGLKHLAKRNKALADRLMSALPVDCGEVTPVEWAKAHDEAGSPSSLMMGGGHEKTARKPFALARNFSIKPIFDKC